MHELSSGLIASEIVRVGKCNLFYMKKLEKIDFTHILAKVYTSPFAGRHFNTAGRMEYTFSFQHQYCSSHNTLVKSAFVLQKQFSVSSI